MGAPTTDRGGITQILTALQEGGCVILRVNNGEEEVETGDSVHAATEQVMAVDMAHVHVQLPNSNREGWVWFVLGNDPEEVAADYTVNLSDWIDPVTDRWWN